MSAAYAPDWSRPRSRSRRDMASPVQSSAACSATCDEMVELYPSVAIAQYVDDVILEHSGSDLLMTNILGQTVAHVTLRTERALQPELSATECSIVAPEMSLANRVAGRSFEIWETALVLRLDRDDVSAFRIRDGKPSRAEPAWLKRCAERERTMRLGSELLAIWRCSTGSALRRWRRRCFLPSAERLPNSSAGVCVENTDLEL